MSFRPQAFGKYFLVDKIATGGMAEIFKAKTYSHGGFENLLVIKRILPHIGENEDFIEMFIDEAKVSVALQHANIVRIYDFGKILDNYFIAMECVDGKDARNILRKLARAKSYLDPRFAAFIAHQTALGLHYAHTKNDLQGNNYGIVHRDISPSNVIISYDGDVKVADFGIAKAESNAYQTRDGVLKGKFEYMSPEQATGKEIDLRSDIFSLGIILYEMLTGRRLFKTESEIATLKKIRDCDFPRPREYNPAIPQELEQIVLKALARYPEDRYQTAHEIGEDLRAFLHPLTTERLRDLLKEFMHDLFAEEITSERSRLEAHSEVAQRLRETTAETAWDGATDSTMGAITQSPATRLWPLLLGIGTAMVGVVAIIIAVVALVWSQQMQAERDARPPELATLPVAKPTKGVVTVLVLPDASIFVDDEFRGTAGSLSLEDLEPGTYTIRLEADGYEPVSEEVAVAAGDSLRFSRTLKATAKPTEARADPPPRRTPKPEASKPPVVQFRTSPAGARVIVDGQDVGISPVDWEGGEEGRSYSVKLVLAGHQETTGTVEGLSEGKTTTFQRALKEEVRPGSLSVFIMDGQWANVYVNGEKLPKPTPLKNWEIAAGTYTIKVENPATGINQEKSVTITAGQNETWRVAL